MSIAVLFEIILAALKFPTELAAFVRLISKSPEEKRAEIMSQVNAWMDESASKDRPTWGQ